MAIMTRESTNAGNSWIGSKPVRERTATQGTGRQLPTSVVPTERLDAIAEAHAQFLGSSLEDICAIKMDIEGAEVKALRSAPRLLSSPTLQAISIEFVPYCTLTGEGIGADGGLELLQILTSNGFSIIGRQPVLDERVYEPSEFQDLVQKHIDIGKAGTTLLAVRNLRGLHF
eukprot:TRINITY_DN33960_c0_g1_i2.p1 TRINITY_DN33960_c0_g1~~TRINITY_DN33960_c0_g1_i2.p1  ORF type:complete len:172 (+),score=30.59 TRINITY_DN33960_c0_g1_i2:1184-1699(+)